MVSAAILDFQKFEILTVGPLYVANTRHLAIFREKSLKRLQIYGDFTGFFKWRPSAILDSLGAIGITHNDDLVGFIVVQNLLKSIQ